MIVLFIGLKKQKIGCSFYVTAWTKGKEYYKGRQ